MKLRRANWNKPHERHRVLHWEKQGLIFCPAGDFGWMNSHAQVPTVLVLHDRLRIFFATRPQPGLTSCGFIDVAHDDPQRIIHVHPRPVLTPGKPGTFDADGVMPSSLVKRDEELLLYYSGWSRLGGKVPYNNATGLAISRDGGLTFERMFDGPILDRTPEEPWSATSPAVIRRPDGWHMWYSSGTGWIDVDGKFEHVYVLKYATSNDGIHWNRDAKPVLERYIENEAQTRPTLAEIDGTWHMWFSYRGSAGFRDSGETYRIGHATSDDLKRWRRDDGAAGISASETGWDSQMICYPEVVRVGDQTLMFYNGNGFGFSGLGYAVLKQTP